MLIEEPSRRRAPARALLALLLAAAASSPAPAAAASPAPAAAAEAPVDGRVVGPDGTPIAGARVALHVPEAPWRRLAAELAGEEPAAVAAARTDGDGRFTLAAPAGLWRLEVTAPGHWPERGELYLDGLPFDRGPIELSPAGGFDLRIVDAAGRPLAGARAAMAVDGHERWVGGADAVWRTTAGEDGRARLPRPRGVVLYAGAVAAGFAPGRLAVETVEIGTLRLDPGIAWTVEVRDRLRRPVAGAMVLTADTVLPLAVTGEDGLAEVRLPAAEPARLLVRSAAGSATLSVDPPRRPRPEDEPAAPRRVAVTVAPEGELTGRVVAEPDRLPLAGARVWVHRRPDLAATTDARGAFRLPFDEHLLREGQLGLAAAAPGHRQIWTSAEVTAGEALLVLAPLAALSGRVVDGAGEPVAGARLLAMSGTPWRPGGWPGADRATSGGDGRFRLGRLDPETLHRLRVEHPDYAAAELEVTTPPAGGAPRQVEVVLDRGARAYGVVFGADGMPLAGATATLRPTRPEQPPFRPRLGSEERNAPSAVSDGEGRFVVDHVVPGRFDLHLAAPGHAPLVVPGVEVPAPPATGDLGSVTLERGAEIAGRVVDADGAPLAGVEVRTIDHGGLGGGGGQQPQAITGADGRFAVRDLVRGAAST